MVKVKRANVVLHIKDFEVDRYLEMGYNVIDEKGKVIKEAVPTDLAFLQTAYTKNKEKIAELEKEIGRLQDEIKKLKSANIISSNEAPVSTRGRRKASE